MNYREKIRKAIECPQFGNFGYGEWGTLRLDQRKNIKRLLDEMDRADIYIRHLYEEIDRLNNIILNQQKRIDKTIQAIDEILIYNDLSDTTSAFGNAPRELKFYLSECDTLEEFDKLKELKENNK